MGFIQFISSQHHGVCVGSGISVNRPQESGPPPAGNIDDVPFTFRLQAHNLATEDIPRITAFNAGESTANQDYLYDASNGRWVAMNGMYYFYYSSNWGLYNYTGTLLYYDVNAASGGTPADGTFYESAGASEPVPYVSNAGVFTRRAALGLYSDQYGGSPAKVGESVMLWRDNLHGGGEAAQTNSMFGPVLLWYGDTPILRLDGADDFLRGYSEVPFTALTVLMSSQSTSRMSVVTGNDVSDAICFGQDFFGNPVIRSDEGSLAGSTALSASTFYVVTAAYSAGLWRLYVDGVEQSSGTLASLTEFHGQYFYIGRDVDQWFDVSGWPWNGDIIAVMAYPTEHRLTVEAYQQTLKPSA